MRIDVGSKIGNAVLLKIDGNLTAGDELTKLRGTVEELLKRGKINQVWDLRKVRKADGVCAGEIEALVKYAENCLPPGRIEFLTLGKISDSRMLGRLAGIAKVHEDEKSAMASFS